MENKILMQEEIDALLKSDDSFSEFFETPNSELVISPEEADVLGEIGNISMGSAATALSSLLNHRVNITSPKVSISNQEDLFNSFTIPYMAIEVKFTDGFEGLNLLIIRVSDASIISNMMMGGDGLNPKDELTEIEMSAAAEAMNQMIGSAATAMSQMFGKPINISPPQSRLIEGEMKDYRPFGDSPSITIVSFRMTIGDLVDTELMQIMSTEVAKEQANLLFGTNTQEEIAPIEKEPVHQDPDIEHLDTIKDTKVVATPKETEVLPGFDPDVAKKYELILDIPLKVSVVLGKSKKTIGEVLRIGPGSIVELDKIIDEDVEILVNGTLVATGEVVVVDENFGVRIKNIISPAERINYIK